MISSVDGKISTGDVDERDVDKDYLKITGLKEGLQQYYDLEQRTDIVSVNSGKVQAKVGVNTRPSRKEKIGCTFVVIDNKPHLKSSGVKYFIESSRGLVLVTTNKDHPAFKIKADNLNILYYPKKIDFNDVFEKLRSKFGFKRATIQTGGTLNSILLREGLIDKVSFVIAPALIGGKNTSTLIDGESLRSVSDLNKIKTLKLEKCEKLKQSYVHLVYKVMN
jgi:2,5-diamino-6-(ribosylamino)-4(3H)-pyrimidinone 5'-phosphate reductase